MDRLETAPALARTIQVDGEQLDVHAIVFFIQEPENQPGT